MLKYEGIKPMVFGFGGSGRATSHQEIEPAALQALLQAGRAQVIDVREADEFEAGHIPGAINMPLSTFQASKLPDAQGRMIILNCLGGKRSASALDQCAAARAGVDTHLAGGFGAWAKAGLPVVR